MRAIRKTQQRHTIYNTKTQHNIYANAQQLRYSKNEITHLIIPFRW